MLGLTYEDNEDEDSEYGDIDWCDASTVLTSAAEASTDLDSDDNVCASGSGDHAGRGHMVMHMMIFLNMWIMFPCQM